MSEQPHNKSPDCELSQDKLFAETVHSIVDSPEQWTAEIERLRGTVDAATREMGKYARQCGEQQAEIERLKADLNNSVTLEHYDNKVNDLKAEIERLKARNQKLAEEKLKYNVDWNRIQQLEARLAKKEKDWERLKNLIGSLDLYDGGYVLNKMAEIEGE